MTVECFGNHRFVEAYVNSVASGLMFCRRCGEVRVIALDAEAEPEE